MARRFRPTWTQDDYQRVKKVHHRHKMMAKVVDSILASGLSYTDVAQKAHVAISTVRNWASGTTKNARIDTIMSVLEALNMEMVLVTRKERHHGQSSKEKGDKPPRSEVGGARQG